MSTENRPLSAPPFESKLPEVLLKGLDDKDRYMLEESDKARQRMEWLMGHSISQASELAEVKQDVKETKEQALKTNGRLLAAEQTLKEHEPAIKTVRFAKRVVGNRWFWVGAAAFIFFALPAALTYAPTPTEFVKIVFGL